MWSWIWFWTWKEWLNVVRTADKAGEKPWVRSLCICARGLGCFIMLWLCLRMMFLVEKEVKEYDIPCQTVQGKCANICNSRVCKREREYKMEMIHDWIFFLSFLVSYSPAWPGTHSGGGAAPEPPPNTSLSTSLTHAKLEILRAEGLFKIFQQLSEEELGPNPRSQMLVTTPAESSSLGARMAEVEPPG